MNNGTNNFQNFIGISSLQKTLRNALIPTETTQQFIVKNGIIKEDELRGENRQILKDIMDDYYRGFISETLSSIDDIDWTSLFEKMEIQLKNGDNKDTLIKEQAEKRKAIYKKFADDDRFKNMFSAKLISDILPEFVIHNNNYSASEKEEKTQVIKLFSRFATSFKDYFKNRANCFSADDISSSSCHRIVNDNAEIFFSNALVYRRIVKNLSNDDINKISGDMKDSLKEMSLEEIYSYEKYGEFITQEGISFYNDICGKVNSFMNLYCQKNKENKNLYKLRKLHKQILCIADTSYEVPYKFESDEEVYQSVNGFLDNISSKHIVERLRKIGDNYNGYNLDKIYIVSKFYESVSQKTYRDWETINTALEIHYNNILPGNGKSKADKVKKAVKNDLQKSITEINELVSNYKLCPDDNIKAETYIHEISHILNNFEAQELKYNPEIHLVESELKASELKNVLDVIMNAFHWCSVFMTEELVDKDNNFYAELEEIYDEIYPVISLYNLVRNYVTQKPYSTKKIKLNFGIPTLADGWSKSKEYSNNAIILMRDNLYYLGIFNAKNKPDKKIIEGNTSENKGDYKKMIYNLLPGPNKMIPKVFLSSKTGVETYKPSAYILEGYKQNKHLKSSKDFDITFCHDLIDYFKNCIAIHPEWKNFGFDFSDTSTYEDISGFYREVELQGYKIDWTYISEKDIDLLQEKGQLYLFQIYNKDFSKKSSGNDNLHTMYLKNLFSEENLKDIVLKLNGEAEIFFRKSSIKNPIIHKKGSILVNRTYEAEEKDQFGNIQIVRKTIPENIYQELYKYFNDKSDKELSDEAAKLKNVVGHHEAATNIVKDYRYTYDKYFLHMPITINFKANKTSFINDRILQYIAKEKDLHVIGIDRGERNLIYVSVIDTCGNIVEQKSFNIVNGYDYQIKLKQQEGARQIARKEWKEIGKIKEIKEGYLSLVIHEISKMVIKYNAIIAMEDLSYGFKKGRFKVERQVYQKFETMLINKLNYLVFKDISITENGGLLKGYQLTYIPEKLKNVGHQCGCIFYVPATYTSKIDPTTGFVNIFKFKDLTVDAKREFIKKFDSIRYDSDKNLFCFTFDYNNFITQNTVMSKSNWSVYTYGVRIKRRFVNGRFSNESDTIDITKDMEKTLEMTDINWRDGHDLRQDIIDYEIVQHIFEIFKLTVQMRNSLSELEDRNYDRLISPVLNENNIFYDSAKAGDALPKDADANGAYCIALKGLYEIKQITENWKEDGKFSRDKLKISNKDWFDFIQNKRYL